MQVFVFMQALQRAGLPHPAPPPLGVTLWGIIPTIERGLIMGGIPARAVTMI